jgi:kinetochore protein Spc7/SPC105
MDFNNPYNEGFSSSPYSGSSVAGSDDNTMPAGEPNSSDSDSDMVDGEGTAMSMVSEDVTGGESTSSTSSSARLDEALRQAATQAGTRGIEFDEHGDDESMEMADDEVTASFQPWVKKGVYAPKVVQDLTSLQDQENLNRFSPAIKARVPTSAEPAEIGNEDEEMSMDVTKAVGSILNVQSPKQSPKGRRKSTVTSRRSSAGRRRSSGNASETGDATMEFTTAVGGIQMTQQPQSVQENDESAIDEDEDMTMEFTGVIGGVLGNAQPRDNSLSSSAENTAQDQNIPPRREGITSSIADETMDMTAVIGGILPPIEERTEPQDSQTMAMDVTTAIGGILPPELNTTVKSQAKKLMELETDAGQLTSSPFQERTSPISPPKSAPKSKTPKHLATIASETGSPSLANVKARPARKSGEGRLSATPKISSQPGTPVKGPSTPSKQLTPLLAKATTPSKTPPMNNVTFRSASPKKLFKAEIKAASTPRSEQQQKTSTTSKLFQANAITGEATPSVVLKPSRRRSSGLGIDKEGLGSPIVEALFDRRGSLGEETRMFVADSKPVRGVRFDDPRVMEQEVDIEREEEERRESGRFILEQEADVQEDVTANLKDMIESMTPKKESKGKLKGRKSLAVGAAKGLLGKRPVELDQDEDDEDSTPKRLKGREGSPVKGVKLPTPAQNMGRMTRAGMKNLKELTANGRNITPTTTTSAVKAAVTTPKHQGRFKDAEAMGATKLPPKSFDEKIESTAVQVDVVDDEDVQEEEKIQLQDFLNMTNIHFMELTTTKRRHTIAPGSAKKPSAHGGVSAPSLEDCVVAALCTMPMLELYQHVCSSLSI